MMDRTCGLVVAVALVACGGAQRRAAPVDETATADPANAGTTAAPDASEPAGDGRLCEQKEKWGPVMLSSADYAARRGSDATTFGGLVTSQVEPAEVCGVNSQLELLVQLRCDDGTNPFGEDRGAAHQARSGSVGAGGRCGSIIDLYEVPCPEQTYQVYLDAYVCEQDGTTTFYGD